MANLTPLTRLKKSEHDEISEIVFIANRNP